MFKERQAVAIPVQEHSQVVIDICLGKFVGKLSQILGVDSTVSVLSQTEFLCKQRTDAKPSAIQARLVMAEVRRRKTELNAFLKFGNSFNRLVQVCIGLVYCGAGEDSELSSPEHS